MEMQPHLTSKIDTKKQKNDSHVFVMEAAICNATAHADVNKEHAPAATSCVYFPPLQLWFCHPITQTDEVCHKKTDLKVFVIVVPKEGWQP